MSGSSQAASPVEERGPPPGPAPVLGSHGSIGSMASMASQGSMGSTTALASDVTTSDSHHQLQRRDSQGPQIIIFNKLSAYLYLTYEKRISSTFCTFYIKENFVTSRVVSVNVTIFRYALWN